MTPSFTITPIKKGVVCCSHTAPFDPEDVRSLAAFLHDYRGKLMVDLPSTSGEECAWHLGNFRPMRPATADEALNWLHNQ